MRNLCFKVLLKRRCGLSSGWGVYEMFTYRKWIMDVYERVHASGQWSLQKMLRIKKQAVFFGPIVVAVADDDLKSIKLIFQFFFPLLIIGSAQLIRKIASG